MIHNNSSNKHIYNCQIYHQIRATRPALRRLRFLIKTIIAQRLSITIATHSAKPTVIQAVHSDKDSVLKLCPVAVLCDEVDSIIGFTS